jgi:dephospho-CoA kinase
MAMISFRRFIREGVYDPSIFKAIFLAGGPGAGKSYVAGKTTSGLGLKLVNSDTALEKLLKKHNVPMDFSVMSPEDTEKKDVLRKRAKEITFGRIKVKEFKGKGALDLYIHGRLGLIVDGTGREFEDIKRQADMLRQMGYDTYMIFVNTSEQVALERNAARPRKLDPSMVTKYWRAVQTNMGKFQNYFRAKNFVVIDNNDAGEDVFRNITKRVSKLVKEPPTSHIAKQWIAMQLQKKRKK